MIRRILAGIFVLWVLGFFWFAVALPGPIADRKTDAIVVPTGGEGRIDRGLQLLARGQAKQLLVSGVYQKVLPHEFVAEYKVPAQTMACCITLGFKAVDTKGNAAETAQWMDRRRFTSVRLVTTDWHMRRAALELRRSLPETVILIRDAVPSEPSLRILFLEYNKLIASALSLTRPG